MVAAFEKTPRLEMHIANMTTTMHSLGTTFQNDRIALNNSQMHLKEMQNALYACESARAKTENQLQDTRQDNRGLTEALNVERMYHHDSVVVKEGLEFKIQEQDKTIQTLQEELNGKTLDPETTALGIGTPCKVCDGKKEHDRIAENYYTLWQTELKRAESLQKRVSETESKAARSPSIPATPKSPIRKVDKTHKKRKGSYRPKTKTTAKEAPALIKDEVSEAEVEDFLKTIAYDLP